jgi:hypothetical protein
MPRVNYGYSQPEDSLFREMNVLMRQYDNAGVKLPQEIRKYRERIADIYQENNIKGQFVKNDVFPRGAALDKLNPGIRDELRSIAEGMMDNDYVYNLHDYENYVDILKDKKFEKWNVQNVNDVIDRLDFLKNKADSEVIKNILSSDQLMDLYDTAINGNVSEDRLLDLILEQYEATGYTGDTLHEAIYAAIEKSGKEEQAKKPVKFGGQSAGKSEVNDNVNDIRLPRGPKMSGNRKAKKKR